MSREIKFRGKRVDNGEWVYGGFYKHDNGSIGILTGDMVSQNDAIIDEVDPATVGQFTGLRDKDGKDVYEEDVVDYYDSYKVWITTKVIDIGSAFALETPENPIPLYEFVDGYIYDGHPVAGIIVRGNVHENPDLLKREE